MADDLHRVRRHWLDRELERDRMRRSSWLAYLVRYVWPVSWRIELMKYALVASCVWLLASGMRPPTPPHPDLYQMAKVQQAFIDTCRLPDGWADRTQTSTAMDQVVNLLVFDRTDAVSSSSPPYFAADETRRKRLLLLVELYKYLLMTSVYERERVFVPSIMRVSNILKMKPPLLTSREN